MPQNEFIFKHFIINQDKTAMKVGTDAMILGAWVGERMESHRRAESEKSGGYKMLDIGTGTGVLSLMLAQRFSPLSRGRARPDDLVGRGAGGGAIDAVEIDENSFYQAKENIENSSWKNRIKIFHSSIQDFEPGNIEKYDLIISNPPYFEHNLKAETESSKYRERSLARSSNTLSFEDLLVHSKRLMKGNGCFYVIIPFVSTETFLAQAEREGLILFDRLNIKSKENQVPVRSILGLSIIKRDINKEELVIYNQDKTYTRDYIRLTGNYHAKGLDPFFALLFLKPNYFFVCERI